VGNAGDSLSHFRLVEKIASGGRGEVWKAVDTRDTREVAIKILAPSFTRDPGQMVRLKDEIQALSALDHPNIVVVHSVEDGERPILCMELVDGVGLAQRIPRGGLALGELLRLALPLSDAVRAAHQVGVTHRDLKPSNVMVGEGGLLKVLGFGLAETRDRDAHLDPDDTPTLTLSQERTLGNAIPYVSPEQVQGKPLDHRSDVFSLGAILYEMACGKRPFGGDSPADIIVGILRDHPQPVTEINEALPRRLEQIIRRCIEKDRELRFPTVQALHAELAQLVPDSA
jgi:serine/threonine protein kinase